ncbi:MAG: TIGR03571 family LLM class oxidoreductase [Pseudomonadota bacterium]
MAGEAFNAVNTGFASCFRPGRLSVGLVVPLESYLMDDLPTLNRHIERAQLAEALGFSALWLRDVPFNVPAFGDVGQMLDPFVYLGALAQATDRIALGVASVILPLRHPAHVAKAAATADVLSGGRVLLGVASGDRPEEYPAMGAEYETRGARFRDSLAYINAAFGDFPVLEADQGRLNGRVDMLPKPTAGRVPLLITGGAQQAPDWVAAHGDGWITYPRNLTMQAQTVAAYRARVAEAGLPLKPVVQSLYVDLADDDARLARPIALGYSAGAAFFRQHLQDLQAIGVNHVAINLRYNNADVETTMKRLASDVLPALLD